MKRGVLLILALLLLLDLADDGYLGKAKFVPPYSTAKTSLTSAPQYDTGKIDSSGSLPSPDWRDMSGPRHLQPVMPLVQLARKIITPCNNGSSGGIPR
jgi:hypothetical protein